MNYYLIENRKTSGIDYSLKMKKITEREYEKAKKDSPYNPQITSELYITRPNNNYKLEKILADEFIYIPKDIARITTGKIYFKSNQDYDPNDYLLDNGTLSAAFENFDYRSIKIKKTNNARKNLFLHTSKINKSIKEIDKEFEESKNL